MKISRWIGFALVAVVIAIVFNKFRQSPYSLDVDWSSNWGDNATAPDMTIAPFEIAVPDNVLDDLRLRLGARRGFVPVGEAGWDDGVPPEWLDEMIKYWSNVYDWRSEEARLNRLQQWTTHIDGLQVHFVWLKGHAPASSTPLLLLHGWPGSFVEFAEVGPMLAGDGYDVVIPSLPGYGFSEAAKRKGLGPLEMGVIFVKLMRRLYPETRYVVQGGDWGSMVAQCMARLVPEEVAALHLNMFPVNIPWWGPLRLWLLGPEDEKERIFPLSNFLLTLWDSLGYFHEQATKPYTVAVALTDSPAGLAAWILEKFHEWTDRGQSRFGAQDGAPMGNITRDELLTNVMIYWVTNTAASSVRLYREAALSEQFVWGVMLQPVEVPVGIADFPRELMQPATDWLPTRYFDIISHHRAARGGHFAAFEEPGELVAAVRKFLAGLKRRGDI